MRAVSLKCETLDLREVSDSRAGPGPGAGAHLGQTPGSPDEVHDRVALFGRPTQVVYEMVGRSDAIERARSADVPVRILYAAG